MPVNSEKWDYVVGPDRGRGDYTDPEMIVGNIKAYAVPPIRPDALP